MKQVTKFYISSFLKNQTYFTPIMVLFLQFNNLSFTEIFLIFTIGSVVSFIVEIPTGVLADLYGKKKSIILSWFGLGIAYIIFGFSSTFWMFVFAQVLWELGNAFRTGTEAAYVYDYLSENKENNPGYTEVKGKQKFYARIGEAIAAAIGGFIAAIWGFNIVFFVAAIPTFVNFLNVISWEKIKENEFTENERKIKNSINHTKVSFSEIIFNKNLLYITLNIMVFSSVLAALQRFIQPYMVEVGVPLSWFGIVYTIALVLTALAVRYSYLVENKLGARTTINVLSIFAVIPAIILGLHFVSIFGIALLFIIVIIGNIRSPIANNEFHSHVSSKNRATSGSILSLSKSIGKIAVLPLAGYVADVWGLFIAIYMLGIIMFIGGLLFFVRKKEKKN